MQKLITNDWKDPNAGWREDDLQAAVVQWLKQNGFDVAADQNGLRTSRKQAAKAKMCGMKAGEPDLRIYLPGGRLVLIEMKCNASLSVNQKSRHAELKALGFPVHVVKAKTPHDAVEQAKKILGSYAQD